MANSAPEKKKKKNTWSLKPVSLMQGLTLILEHPVKYFTKRGRRYRYIVFILVSYINLLKKYTTKSCTYLHIPDDKNSKININVIMQ